MKTKTTSRAAAQAREWAEQLVLEGWTLEVAEARALAAYGLRHIGHATAPRLADAWREAQMAEWVEARPGSCDYMAPARTDTEYQRELRHRKKLEGK